MRGSDPLRPFSHRARRAARFRVSRRSSFGSWTGRVSVEFGTAPRVRSVRARLSQPGQPPARPRRQALRRSIPGRGRPHHLLPADAPRRAMPYFATTQPTSLAACARAQIVQHRCDGSYRRQGWLTRSTETARQRGAHRPHVARGSRGPERSATHRAAGEPGRQAASSGDRNDRDDPERAGRGRPKDHHRGA